MQSLTLSQMKPISSLPKNYSELSKTAREGNDLVFLKRNAPFVVLLDFKRWQKLTDLEQKHDEMKAFANIEKSEQEFKAGKAKILTSLADL